MTEDEIDSIRHMRKNEGVLNAPADTLFANPQFPWDDDKRDMTESDRRKNHSTYACF